MSEDDVLFGYRLRLFTLAPEIGVRGFLLNQNPERLTRETLNALTTNRSHLITTALNAHAAGLIAREWAGDPPAGAITGLPRFTFLAQATSHGQLTRPFLFENLAVTDLFSDAYEPEKVADIQPLIDEAFGRKDAAETIRELDTLDERIYEHLKPQTEKESSGTGEDTPGPVRSEVPQLPARPQVET